MKLPAPPGAPFPLVRGFFGTESITEFYFSPSLQIACGMMLLWCEKKKKSPDDRLMQSRTVTSEHVAQTGACPKPVRR